MCLGHTWVICKQRTNRASNCNCSPSLLLYALLLLRCIFIATAFAFFVQTKRKTTKTQRQLLCLPFSLRLPHALSALPLSYALSHTPQRQQVLAVRLIKLLLLLLRLLLRKFPKCVWYNNKIFSSIVTALKLHSLLIQFAVRALISANFKKLHSLLQLLAAASVGSFKCQKS